MDAVEEGAEVADGEGDDDGRDDDVEPAAEGLVFIFCFEVEEDCHAENGAPSA